MKKSRTVLRFFRERMREENSRQDQRKEHPKKEQQRTSAFVSTLSTVSSWVVYHLVS